MKVNIELDISPQEARELMGWPDLSDVHETLIESFNEQIRSGDNEAVMAMMKPFLQDSQKSFSAYQTMMEGFASFKQTKK